jgi:hypothetical protein
VINFTGVIGMINYNYELRGGNHNRYVAYVDDLRPCLWKQTVVEGILRKKLNIIVEVLCLQLKGKDVDISSIIESTAKELQDIFYGRNQHYRSSTWNSEKRLGDAIARGTGFECGTHNAAYSAALCMLYEFSNAYLAYENEEIGDECDDDYEKEVDHIIAFYVALYIGKKNQQENSLIKTM